MNNLQIAFIFLVVFSLGFHWAAWCRFGECDAMCKELTTRVEWLETCRESQAKQIAGLQAWCQNLDRAVDAKPCPQPGLTPMGGPTRLQRAAEEAIRLPPADPAGYIATNYPKRDDEV